MNVHVVRGVGYGKTLLSAFDSALKDAGVYNYNLIILSSVIPIGARIINSKFKSKKEECGYRLYVIKAEVRSKELGEFIGAALGWYQFEDGRGTFVEHTSSGGSQRAVREELAEGVQKSLSDLCKSRGYKMRKKQIGIKTSIVQVDRSPACALVLAVYEAEGWK
jgi:arginine decarboxylase